MRQLMLTLLYVVAGLCQNLVAQQDSSFTLPPATIVDAKFERTGYSVWQADSLPFNGGLSLSDRLSWDNALLLRTQSPDGLSTVSARGAGPSRTPVVWQGINLQSTMNGVTDASLIPLWAGDHVLLRYGGQSAAQSSGAMGGVLLVDAAEQTPAGFSGQAALAAGSFGRMEQSVSASVGGETLSSTLRACYQQAENDFPFQNTTMAGSPEVVQHNNAMQRFDLQQFNSWSPSSGRLLKTSFWHQRAHREIPPPMTAAVQTTWQDDRSTRIVAGWEQNTKRGGRWYHRGAWTDETILYHLNNNEESSRARTAQALSNYSTTLGKHWFVKSGVQAWWQQARADGYSDSLVWVEQWRLAMFGSLEYQSNGWTVSTQIRKEWLTTTPNTPVTWSVGVEKQLKNKQQIHLHASRNFNLPTFNDLYWRTLGNPDLRAENGYSTDVGYQSNIRAGSWSIVPEATLFSLLVDDWIIWLPGSDGLFRPGNLRKVWSRGVETSLRLQRSWQRWSMQVQARYQFVRATNTSVYTVDQSALNKQLPYVPQHTLGGGFQVTRGQLRLTYLHQWYAGRYTNASNTTALPAYSTAQFIAGYNHLWKGNAIGLNFRINNCWNTDYQSIAYQPMPGRSWNLGVSFGW
ncbi:MAG: TonB-dependent receptor [Saprospiraceae bacterium]|nr:TonB-dependent receptor [Saprospiraceae bacterium]